MQFFKQAIGRFRPSIIWYEHEPVQRTFHGVGHGIKSWLVFRNPSANTCVSKVVDVQTRGHGNEAGKKVLLGSGTGLNAS